MLYWRNFSITSFVLTIQSRGIITHIIDSIVQQKENQTFPKHSCAQPNLFPFKRRPLGGKLQVNIAVEIAL